MRAGSAAILTAQGSRQRRPIALIAARNPADGRAGGRLLTGEEQVHHRDRDRADNAPGNLVVLPSVSAHRRLHIAERRVGRELDPALFCGMVVTGAWQELPFIAGVTVQ